jgi:predicted secreted Zn-dependent protease
LKLVAMWVVAGLLCVAPALGKPIDYNTPAWKDEIAHGCLPYHQLVRADFPVTDRAFPRYAMYTSGFFHYNYRYHWATQEGRTIVHITEWSVRSGFNRNRSWRKNWSKTVAKLLPHEQGHLDINELHVREVASMELVMLPVGEGENAEEAVKDLKVKLKALATKVSKDDQTEQDAYDAKTAHGTNQAGQLLTTTAIQKRLKEADISNADWRSSDQVELEKQSNRQ